MDYIQLHVTKLEPVCDEDNVFQDGAVDTLVTFSVAVAVQWTTYNYMLLSWNLFVMRTMYFKMVPLTPWSLSLWLSLYNGLHTITCY